MGHALGTDSKAGERLGDGSVPISRTSGRGPLRVGPCRRSFATSLRAGKQARDQRAVAPTCGARGEVCVLVGGRGRYCGLSRI